MFSYLWHAFASGFNFYLYLIVDSWWWIFGVIAFVLMAILENSEVEEMYLDDKREVF